MLRYMRGNDSVDERVRACVRAYVCVCICVTAEKAKGENSR